MDAQTIAKQLVGLGLSQAEIHRRCGVSQTAVSHLISGRRGKRTSFDVVQRLQSLLIVVTAEQNSSDQKVARGA